MDKNKISGVDAIRTIACIMVMAHHAVQLLQTDNAMIQPFLHLCSAGSAGVAFFFVLSGYLLSMPFWKAWGTNAARPSLKTYTIRRFARIAPAFYLNLTICFILTLLLLPDTPYLLGRFIAGITFLSGFHWITLFPSEINGPLWSISFEVVSYSLLGLFMVIWFKLPLKRTFVNGILFWIGVILFTLYIHSLFLAIGKTDGINAGFKHGLVNGAKSWWPVYNPFGFFATFAMGVVAAGISTSLRMNKVDALKIPGDAVVIIGFIFAASLLWKIGEKELFQVGFLRQPYSFPLFGMTVSMLLIFLPFVLRLRLLTNNKLVSFISEISYGLYIWHFLLLTMSYKLIFKGEKFVSISEWVVFLTVVYGCATLIATLSWKFFEKPIVKWSQKGSYQ